jgi:hypothetical protein
MLLRSKRRDSRTKLCSIRGTLTIVWGAAHLYPTTKIVRGFGDITRDNQLVLTMEWISEAFLVKAG